VNKQNIRLVVAQSEGLSDSNHCICTPRLVLSGNTLPPGGSQRWKKLASRAVAPPTAKLAPRRKVAVPLRARNGGTSGRPRLSAASASKQSDQQVDDNGQVIGAASKGRTEEVDGEAAVAVAAGGAAEEGGAIGRAHDGVGDGVPAEDDGSVAGVRVRVAEAEDGAVAAPGGGRRRRRQYGLRRRDHSEEKRDGAHQEAELAHVVVALAPLHAGARRHGTHQCYWLAVCWQRRTARRSVSGILGRGGWWLDPYAWARPVLARTSLTGRINGRPCRVALSVLSRSSWCSIHISLALAGWLEGSREDAPWMADGTMPLP
jgi:hypothetical protein